MTNILLRCANHFEQFLKANVRNKNKKMINFVIQRSSKIFDVSVRDIASTAEIQEIQQSSLVAEQFDYVSDYLNKYNLINKKQIEKIIDLINSSGCVSKYQIRILFYWCSIVADCLPFERVQLGKSLWSILNICNFKISITHYNALLKLYVENEQDFSPMEFIRDMESKGLCPNNNTYEACINHYCRKGNINEALRFVGDMRKLHFLNVTEAIFNSIIMGLSKSGNIEEVNEIVYNMKQRGMKLSTKTYTGVICTYAKLNEMHKIVDVLETCSSNNIHFSNKDILNVMYILAENRHTKCIHILYKYLMETKEISNTEIQIMLKLINIGEIHIAGNVLLQMCSNKVLQFENIMKLMLKHMIHNNKMVYEVTKLCAFSKDEKLLKKFLLLSLYYSLANDSNLSLPLLRICKHHYTVRPHFFWPLLFKAASNYDLQGILNILNIMVNDFNTSPCVDTVADYVLPFTYGNISCTRNLLMEHKLSETVINNAYLSFMLRKRRVKEAAIYKRTFEGKYFYKIIAHDLRYACAHKKDIRNFVYISRNFVENIDDHSIPKSNDKSCTSVPVSMDKQLLDFMIDFPSHKIWITKTIRLLVNENISLKLETRDMITNFLNKKASNDVTDMLDVHLSNKVA